MATTLAATLATLGDGVHRSRLDDGRAVLAKVRRAAPPGFFAQEAHGLALLRGTRTVRVPDVHFVDAAAIVLSDLGNGRVEAAAWRRAGRNLARLHRHTAAAFGLDRDGWCGDSPQTNSPLEDGWRFFAERRLLPQARRAFDTGRLGATEVAAIERLCGALRARIPELPPALVHGDLWRGNLHECADGEVALIDAAAAHYGWAETDLAMLTLFGAPPADLFDAYDEEAGARGSAWRARAPIYNLYHLLNHLNLFGAGYLGAVRDVLRAV